MRQYFEKDLREQNTTPFCGQEVGSAILLLNNELRGTESLMINLIGGQLLNKFPIFTLRVHKR